MQRFNERVKMIILLKVENQSEFKIIINSLNKTTPWLRLIEGSSHKIYRKFSQPLMRKQVISRKYCYVLGEDLKTQIMKVVLITLSVLITLICFEINRSDFEDHILMLRRYSNITVTKPSELSKMVQVSLTRVFQITVNTTTINVKCFQLDVKDVKKICLLM